eukprot:CAMPEP_0170175626 /NCGR_PEP_ID=MMETSP0040_2-20121228/8673_1 /TAXON_ID=641309 /ORGANISM="Lotharella oceanica, Strain CCMP622" /LENGTH=67 /DNA_ID=CAMNT_0010417673 /DNA_START=572 /DNA_END=775 /DNA_ORIENTATION=-
MRLDDWSYRNRNVYAAQAIDVGACMCAHRRRAPPAHIVVDTIRLSATGSSPAHAEPIKLGQLHRAYR